MTQTIYYESLTSELLQRNQTNYTWFVILHLGVNNWKSSSLSHSHLNKEKKKISNSNKNRPASETHLEVHRKPNTCLIELYKQPCDITSFPTRQDTFLLWPFPLFALMPAKTSMARTGRGTDNRMRAVVSSWSDNLWSGRGQEEGEGQAGARTIAWSQWNILLHYRKYRWRAPDERTPAVKTLLGWPGFDWSVD